MTNEQDTDKDLKIISRMILIYCQGNHGEKEELCPTCRDLLNYANERRRLCPLDPKPACKNCSIHCYKPEYREKIRQVMRYSGKRFYKLLKG
jgi:predicted amidophosphoribosyltransferase